MSPHPEGIPFEEATLGPFEFLWSVAETGYRWDQDLHPIKGEESGPYLVPAATPSHSSRRYAPLAIRNLHRRFRRLPPTQEAVRRFANRYGLLTRGESLYRPMAQEDRVAASIRHLAGELGGASGEPLSLWLEEIASIDNLLEVWDGVKAEDAGRLSRWVIWRDNPRQVNFRREGPEGHVRSKNLAHEGVAGTRHLLDRWRHGEIVGPASYYVHLEINRQLLGHVSPAVLPFRKGEIRLFPDSLIAAIYTLAALELSGRQRPSVICVGCGSYFIPAHGRQRFCEDACRKRSWHQKHKKEVDDGRPH